MDIDELASWKAPTWHPDFGDPAVEFDMLIDFCRKLLSIDNQFNLKLDTPEDGYINVDIFDQDGNKYGELYIVDDEDNKKYGLFYDMNTDEKEVYFDSIEEGLSYLRK